MVERAACSAVRSRIATSARSSTARRTRRLRTRRRARRRGARDPARRGALDLREPADLDRRAAARGRSAIRAASIRGAERGPHYTGAFTSIKSFFRLADGLRTVFLVARDGRLLDIVDIERWGGESSEGQVLEVPGARAFAAHAAATLGGPHVCVVLSPQREIKVFAEGTQVFTFRHADWHLLDLPAKYPMWAAAVGTSALARRLFQTALDLADARAGRAVRRAAAAAGVAGRARRRQDRLDMELVGERSDPDTPSRRHLLHVLAGRSVTDFDATVLDALATLDGAVVADRPRAAARGRRHPASPCWRAAEGGRPPRARGPRRRWPPAATVRSSRSARTA